MPEYEKSVLDALKNGPKMGKELIEELCPEKMSRKKLYKTLNELENEERIICRPKRTDKGPKWTSNYALPKHQYLLEVDYSEVARAVKNLRLELCRNPEVEEVAAAIGKDPENVRKVLFEHALELEWRPPTPSEKEEEAEKSCEMAREIAAIFKYSLERDYGIENKEAFWRDPVSQISAQDFWRAHFLLEHKFESIKEEDIPFMGALAGPGFYIGPSEPRERNRKEAIEAMRSLHQTSHPCLPTHTQHKK